MANDVSYFKVLDDDTRYSFDDADGEVRIAGNTSNIGTLSNLTTTAKSSIVAAINEVDADIATINTVSSGTLTGNWLNMNYAKNGNGMKFLRCLAGPNAAMAAGTQRFVGTLPSEYRPSYNIDQPIVVNATTSSAVIAILNVDRATGAVNITPMSAISTSTPININLAYI
jgi:hypothetical protein